MDAVRKGCLFVFFMVISMVVLSAEFPDEQNTSLSTLLDVLLAVYDYDSTLVPDEPNEIIALETSADSKDQLAWELFKLIRYELDPNSRPAVEETPIIADETLPTPMAKAGGELEQSLSAEMTSGFETESMFTLESAEELSNPLGSCIIPAGTYYITTLPLQIEEHVIICAGAKLIAPYDPNTPVIEVLPGGLLETGKAADYKQEEYPNILPPVEIVPEDPNIAFWHNSVGIYVHRGADPKTRLENLNIIGCTAGIVVDEALVWPLRNIITVGCYDGVDLYAPAGIVDCQFWDNGSVWYWMDDYIFAHLNEYRNGTIFEGLALYAGAGVYVNLDGQAFPYPEVSIERTVMDTADAGLLVAGITANPNWPDPNIIEQLMPRVSVVNSAFTLDYFYGLYQTEGQAQIDVQYCAFGDNEYYNTNVDLPYIGCIVFGYDPFYLLETGNRLYVNPASAMVDAGYGAADDGTGTCHLWPDMGPLDMGCHVALGVSGGFGIQASPADFNWDGIVDELDLELMEMCMGAVTDPNIVKLDGNYDSRVNLPDFGLFAADYGYCPDPNECTNNDPNCTRSDFNDDDHVDLEDLTILAESWLTVVFDEYRLCSVCNLHTGPDPNDPNVPDGITLIDQRDMDVFMADWGIQYASDPNIVIEQSASRVSVAVENPAPAWKISAFLDEELIGQWTPEGLASTMFDADLTRYGPGSHRLKIVRNILNGVEITEQVLTDPNSTGLYFADIPDTFEPNEPYILRGFNLGDELNVTIKNIYDQPIYDVNLPSGALNLQIASGTFNANQICTVSMASGSNIATSDLVREFREEDYAGQTIQMVIIMPDKDVFKRRKPVIQACAQACVNRNVNWVPLYHTDVTPWNLTRLLQRPTMRWVYWCGHAHSQVFETPEQAEQGEGGVWRTCMSCWKPGEHWWNLDEKILALSWTRQTSPNNPLLPNNWDYRGFDLWWIGMGDDPDKKIVFIDGCQSARIPDMALTFGIGNSGNQDQIYIGWKKDITVGRKKETFTPRNFVEYTSHTNAAIKLFWERMGTGMTVEQALEETTKPSYLSQDTIWALWGLDGATDFVDENENNEDYKDNIRVIGDGLTAKLGY